LLELKVFRQKFNACLSIRMSVTIEAQAKLD
jgi:hypothetical protein